MFLVAAHFLQCFAERGGRDRGLLQGLQGYNDQLEHWAFCADICIITRALPESERVACCLVRLKVEGAMVE